MRNPAINMARAALAVRVLVAATAVSALLAFQTPLRAQAPAFEPKEETPEQFPDFPNREDTFYSCTACHAFKLVAQQGMSRPRWDATIDMMTDRHGMGKIEQKDKQPLLDYLEKAFPEKAEESRGWQNPFLKK